MPNQLFDSIRNAGGMLQKLKAAPLAAPTQGALSGPGAAEQQWETTKNQYAQPTATDKLWGQIGNTWQTQQGQGPTIAQQGYQQYQQNAPLPANLDPYYQNAWQHSAADLNRQWGGRGQYNSSNALQALGQSRTDLAADQSKAEADYALKRVAEQRAWQQAASDEAIKNQTADLWRLGLVGGIANDASQNDLARLAGGMAGASQAQQAEQGRVRGQITDTENAADAAMRQLFAQYGDMAGADQSLMGTIFGSAPAAATEQANYARGMAESQKGDAANLVKLVFNKDLPSVPGSSNNKKGG